MPAVVLPVRHRQQAVLLRSACLALQWCSGGRRQDDRSHAARGNAVLDALRLRRDDAQRRRRHSHAERGNDHQRLQNPCSSPACRRSCSQVRPRRQAVLLHNPCILDPSPDERHPPVMNLRPFERSVDHCARRTPGHEAPVFFAARSPVPGSGSARLVAADQAFVHCMWPDHLAFLFYLSKIPHVSNSSSSSLRYPFLPAAGRSTPFAQCRPAGNPADRRPCRPGPG